METTKVSCEAEPLNFAKSYLAYFRLGSPWKENVEVMIKIDNQYWKMQIQNNYVKPTNRKWENQVNPQHYKGVFTS